MTATVHTPTQLDAAQAVVSLVGEGLTTIWWQINRRPAIEGHVSGVSQSDEQVRSVVEEYALLIGGEVVEKQQDGYKRTWVCGTWDGVPVEVWGHVEKTEQQANTQTVGA